MELYNDDCFNVFSKLETNSVDLVIVDLPYGQTACKWDNELDLDLMWSELKRICKPNANFCFFTTVKYGVKLINSNPKWFRYDLVWEKSRSAGFLSSKSSPLRSHEMIYIFGKPSGGKKTYNPQLKTGEKPYDRGLLKNVDNKIYGLDGTTSYQLKKNNGVRHPRSVVKFSNPNNKSVHPTQKPVDLLEFLVKSYSNENDCILDFTMGSGSTGVSCKNTDRKFIGIEMDRDYFNIATERINE